MNLVLHCGAAAVSREEVAAVQTPRPTETWMPIAHEAFVCQVEKALTALDLRVVNQAHALSHQGDRYFGLMQVANQACQAADDFGYVLGLRNSHDKTYPAGLVVGHQVFVCDNLGFSGEIKIARKHTTFIERDLPGLTSRAVGLLCQKWTTMSERISVYKQTELGNSQVHDLLIRSVDTGAAVITQLPKILGEWRQPSHPEFAPRTAWSLFNAFTEVSKGSGLDNQTRRTIALHGLLDSACNYQPVLPDVIGDAQDAEVLR